MEAKNGIKRRIEHPGNLAKYSGKIPINKFLFSPINFAECAGKRSRAQRLLCIALPSPG